MLKKIGMSVVLVAAAAGTMFVAKAAPEREAFTAAPKTVPSGDKPFAPICKSNGVIEGRSDPAWVGASFANDHCTAPPMPAVVNGLTASREQVVASMAAMKNYTAASDAFERCVQDFVTTYKARSQESRQPVNTPLVIIENHRIVASQRNRKLVIARVNATINAFNEYGSGCGG